MSEGIYWLSCFEAQQAPEPYLEALIVALTGVYPFTRDLAELLESLRSQGISPPKDLFVCADALTPHYTLSRYPGRIPVTYNEGLAKRCVDYAEKIIGWVKRVSESQE